MQNIFLVALGGALGSVCRHLVNMASLKWFGPGFPWGTLTVNILGSLAIGMLTELIALKLGASMPVRLLTVTGFLGGFTTFSAFSLDVAVMVERGDILTAGLYVAASVVISILALFVGLALVRQLV